MASDAGIDPVSADPGGRRRRQDCASPEFGGDGFRKGRFIIRWRQRTVKTVRQNVADGSCRVRCNDRATGCERFEQDGALPFPSR